MVGSLAILTRAQRPLNTTTNGTSVLTEPFFVKPTGLGSKQEQTRGGGGNSFYSSVHDPTGIRNKERMMTPPHPNSHLDIFIPPLNVVGGQQSAQQLNPGPNTRLHTAHKQRPSKFNVLRELVKTANATQGFDHGILKKKVPSKPEPFVQTSPHDDPDKEMKGPSSKGEAIQKIKDLRIAQDNQHTPSPPSYNHDDIDVDEKLGVKCSFEKPCAWTFSKNVSGSNFEVTTGALLKESNVTGLLLCKLIEIVL